MSKILIAITTALALSSANINAAETECIDLGGVAIPNFFPEGEGKPIIISASLIGSATNAAGKITGQKKTDTGLEMQMEHYFGTQQGGSVYTNDIGVLTAVPSKPGRFMIEITYDIQEGKGRGHLKGYKGQFRSYGLVDLRDENNMQGLVRYSGKICK